MTSIDDRDSVRSNIRDLGPYGALEFSRRWLQSHSADISAQGLHGRRISILTIREASRQLQDDIRLARRLAAAHESGLRALKRLGRR